MSEKEEEVKEEPTLLSKSEPVTEEPESKTDFYMSESVANKTYAELISRDGAKNKKSNVFENPDINDMKGFKKVDKTKTTFDNPIGKEELGKRKFKNKEDNITLFDSSDGKNPKAEYKKNIGIEGGKKRFDYLENNVDYTQKYKKEEKFGVINNKNECKKKRINDCFKRNPIEILDKDQTAKMNEEKKYSVRNRTKAYIGYMGSKNTQRLFNDAKDKAVYVDKITNEPENKLKMSIMENRKNQKYARKNFGKYLVGNKNQVSFI